MIDIEKLIHHIYSRSPIWDQRNPLHNNRELILNLWKEISENCETTPDAAKSKWKNLRDSFRTEYKKNGKRKSNNTEHRPTWIWYESLLFLRDQIATRNKRNNFLEPILKVECDENALTEYSISSSNSLGLEESDREVESTILESERQGAPNQSTPLLILKSNDNGKRLADDELQNIEKKIKIIDANEYNSGIPNDDSFHFLVSLHKPLTSLSVERQMFLRYKIQELIFNEISRSTSG